eukprot:GHVL01019210.1.p1 GENE.GHVL01019210.1~~GHVL01019210.1.p1  ORF type:complete len:168 (+),score=20.87 GHVL01019210.1:93-596(+)
MEVQTVKTLQLTEICMRMIRPVTYTNMDFSMKAMLAKARLIKNLDELRVPSKKARWISSYFTQFGMNHRFGVRVGPLLIDMLIGNNLAVNVDERDMYYRNTSTRTAESLLHHTLLRHLGFKVVHLSVEEWIQCDTQERKIAYCATFWKNVIEPSRIESIDSKKMEKL